MPALLAGDDRLRPAQLQPEPLGAADDRPDRHRPGLDVDLKVPQPVSPDVPSPSQIRGGDGHTARRASRSTPTRPTARSPASTTRRPFGTEDEAHCPEFSKVGTVSVDSSALPGPSCRDASTSAIRSPATATGSSSPPTASAPTSSCAGTVSPDPQTGQLAISFKDLPQTPFYRLRHALLRLRTRPAGDPDPAAAPTQVDSEFEPWDDAPAEPDLDPVLHPRLGPERRPPARDRRGPSPRRSTAGMADNTAGHTARSRSSLNRADGDQNLRALNVATPPGFSATLKGIPYCPEAALAGASRPAHAGSPSRRAQPARRRAGSAAPRPAPAPAATALRLRQGLPRRPLQGRAAQPRRDRARRLRARTTSATSSSGPRSTSTRPTAQVTAISDPLPQILEGIPLRSARS